jgi:GT2 family glycosyltransferase
VTSLEHPELHPVVSVCIANYNGENLLDDCIRSVRAQEFAGAVEILVHDDASTDHSLAILASRHPDVIVMPSQDNVGYCESNNRLASRARGEYLLLLNNDAALRQGALRALVDAAKAAPPLCVLTLAQYDWTSGRLVDLGVRLDFMHTPVANLDRDCARIAYVQGACLFIRRDAWELLGGFPDWMESNAEDTYLCTVARLHGGVVRVIAGSGYDHRQGASFGGNRNRVRQLRTTYRRRYLSERNRASLVFVCTPTWLAWPCYALQLITLVVEGTLVTVAKPSFAAWKRIYWAAVRDSLGMFPRLRRARCSVQAGRRIGFLRYVSVFDWAPHKLVVLFRHGLPELR